MIEKNLQDYARAEGAFFSGPTIFESLRRNIEAAEALESAGRCFSEAKDFKRAEECYAKAAEFYAREKRYASAAAAQAKAQEIAGTDVAKEAAVPAKEATVPAKASAEKTSETPERSDSKKKKKKKSHVKRKSHNPAHVWAGGSSESTDVEVEPDVYPQARRDHVMDDYHGTKVPDPYRWLEDISSKGTKEFVQQLNGISQPFLKAFNVRGKVEKALVELGSYAKLRCPTSAGEFYLRSTSTRRAPSSWTRRSSPTTAPSSSDSPRGRRRHDARVRRLGEGQRLGDDEVQEEHRRGSLRRDQERRVQANAMVEKNLQDYARAAGAFFSGATIFESLRRNIEAAEALGSAGRCFSEAKDFKRAEECYAKAAELYAREKRYASAAAAQAKAQEIAGTDVAKEAAVPAKEATVPAKAYAEKTSETQEKMCGFETEIKAKMPKPPARYTVVDAWVAEIATASGYLKVAIFANLGHFLPVKDVIQEEHPFKKLKLEASGWKDAPTTDETKVGERRTTAFRVTFLLPQIDYAVCDHSYRDYGDRLAMDFVLSVAPYHCALFVRNGGENLKTSAQHAADYLRSQNVRVRMAAERGIPYSLVRGDAEQAQQSSAELWHSNHDQSVLLKLNVAVDTLVEMVTHKKKREKVWRELTFDVKPAGFDE